MKHTPESDAITTDSIESEIEELEFAIRKNAFMKQGLVELKNGQQALKNQDWSSAIMSFSSARNYLPNTGSTRNYYSKASTGIADAYYHMALTLMEAKNYNEAEKCLRSAQEYVDSSVPIYQKIESTLKQIRTIVSAKRPSTATQTQNTKTPRSPSPPVPRSATPSPRPTKKTLSIKGHSKAHGESIAVDVPSSWSVEEPSMPIIVKTAYDSSRWFYVSIVVCPTRLKARGYDTSELTINLKNPSTCGLFAKTVTSLDFHETASTPTTLCGFPAAITTGWYQQMMLGESIPIASRVYVMYDERLDNVIYLIFTGLQQRSFSQEQLNTINEIAATLRNTP